MKSNFVSRVLQKSALCRAALFVGGLGAALILGGSAQAAVYYVDPSAGRDSGNGSQQSPWKTLANAASQGKLAGLKGGDSVLLRSGNHGSVTISGKNDSPVTIAAEPGQTPQLTHLEIKDGAKWVIKGLTISPSFDAVPSTGAIVTVGANADDVTLEDCFVYVSLDSSKWGIKEWMQRTDGIDVSKKSSHIILRNNYVLNTRMGVILDSANALFEGNVIAHFSGDGLRIKNDGITAQYNVIKCSYVSMRDGDPNHDDMIQTFTEAGEKAKGAQGLRGVKMIGNLLIARENPRQPWPNFMGCHGIGCFDGPNVDFVVEKNVIMTQSFEGIVLNLPRNCQVSDNVCYCNDIDPADPRRKPTIRLSGGRGKKAQENEVKDNVAKNNHAYKFEMDPAIGAADHNDPVSKEIYEKRLKEVLDVINTKFGKFHPVAKLPRLEQENGEANPTASTGSGFK